MITAAEIETVAQAIYDAVDTISGDTIATVVSMSDHLFEIIDDGETEVEAVLRATMSVCRDAARAAIAALDKARGDEASPLMAFAAYAQQRADELAATCEESRHDRVRAIKRIEWLKVREAALNHCGVEPGYLRRQITDAALRRAAAEADKRGWGAMAFDRRHCSDYTQGARDAADEIAAAIREMIPTPPSSEGA